MQLFADTSDPNVIEVLYKRGIIQGVTTNPTTASEYIKQNGGTIRELALDIAARAPVPVSIEAVGCGPPDYSPESITADRLYTEGAKIIDWALESGAEFWQKMPTIPQGVEATFLLVRDFGEAAKVNATLGFDFQQALRAAEAGAHVFSLFMGRMQANGEDPIPVAQNIIDEYKKRNFSTGFLAASMRTPELIIDSWKAGADIATAPPAVLDELAKKYPQQMKEMLAAHPPKRARKLNSIPAHYDAGEFKHPLLEPGLQRFVSDAKSVEYDLLADAVTEELAK